MRFPLGLIVLAASAVFLTSCGDSHDKLMEDQRDWLDEMTQTLNGVADGSMSSSEAAEKIRELSRDAEDFVSRKEALNKDLDPAEAMKILSEHSKASGEAFQEYLAAAQRVAASGRATEELREAMENMDTP